jgi:hypothetical protein
MARRPSSRYGRAERAGIGILDRTRDLRCCRSRRSAPWSVISNDSARSGTSRSGGGRERATRPWPPAPATKRRVRHHRFCAANLAAPAALSRALRSGYVTREQPRTPVRTASAKSTTLFGPTAGPAMSGFPRFRPISIVQQNFAMCQKLTYGRMYRKRKTSCWLQRLAVQTRPSDVLLLPPREKAFLAFQSAFWPPASACLRTEPPPRSSFHEQRRRVPLD